MVVFQEAIVTLLYHRLWQVHPTIRTRAVDQCKLKQDMRLAIEAYTKQVDGCPCGELQIRLYCGAESSEKQEVREKLLNFLKGSDVSKESLCTTAPTLH